MNFQLYLHCRENDLLERKFEGNKVRGRSRRTLIDDDDLPQTQKNKQHEVKRLTEDIEKGALILLIEDGT